MLELEHVGKTYADHRVLDDIDLAIEDGQIVSVLGPSGGGETTLLNIFLGITDATDGQILWNGDDITRTPMEKCGFNIVFQACHGAYYAGAKPYLHGSAATSTSSPPAPSKSLDSTSLRLAGGHLMITLFSSSSWTSSSAEIEVRARPHATFYVQLDLGMLKMTSSWTSPSGLMQSLARKRR